jgi:uncharacterized membrane protein
MSTLIAIGYPDETTAERAAEEAQRLAKDLVIQPDAIAVIRRDKDGRFHVTTNHNPVVGEVSWGMFWGFLFGLLFFVPLLGVVIGAGLGALMGLLDKADIDQDFQDRVRDMLQPGTSALFLIVREVTLDKTIAALSKFGGTVLKTSLPTDAEAKLQEALHGTQAGQAVAAASSSA